MNGKKARALRKAIYGTERSYRARDYAWKSNGSTAQPTLITVDGYRRDYQQAKRAASRG